MAGDPAARLAALRDRMAAASPPSGRPPTLIAVSKTHPPEVIAPVLAAGHRDFGENRVQEARGKWPALKATGSGVCLHLIGPLQTNKVDEALALFDVIHTVDRPRLAEALAKRQDAGASLPRLLVQVNTGEEPQKSGVAPAAAPAFLADLRGRLGLKIEGLMCIPPVDVEPAPHFALLDELAKEAELPWRSMGMSGDYEIAIQQGATHVRLGTAVFGPRGGH